MESFGCCSSYVECSIARKCLHLKDTEYQGCAYRQNLEAGRIFYGPKETPKPEVPVRNKKAIFLHCLNRLFSIRSRDSKSGLSYQLTEEQADKIESFFDSSYIPYKFQIDSMQECVIDKPTEDDPAPANSMVTFKIGEDVFNILNWNDWLIKRKTAEIITKAFDNNFIEAEICLCGRYANVDKVSVQAFEKRAYTSGTATANKANEKPSIQTSMEPQPARKPKLCEVPPAASNYKQISMFDM